MKTKILICLLFVLQAYSSISQNNQLCHTPGGNRALVFNPYSWNIGNTSLPVWQTSTDQQYSYTEFIEYSDPGTSPSITLNDFIDQMNETDIAILYFESHASEITIAVESYSKTPEGLAERDFAYETYLDEGIDADFISCRESEDGYHISLTDVGLDNWCQRLGQSIVYVNACHSSGLNDNWHSLVALGYNAEISGFAGADNFFERLNGTRDRGPNNTSRSVNDARDGINHLVVEGNSSVVLSPVVIDHQPENYELVTEGQTGYVEFDCEMDMGTDPATIVTISGNIGQLENVSWANNHRIEFTVTNLEQFSHVDFRVVAQAALSAYNQSQLDGNCNPDQQNGVGPNGDFYSWTSLTSPYAMMDFENGADGAVIQSSIPGMQFITTQGYDWIYGDKTTDNYNIYPYGNANYWCDGNFFAWLGENQGSGRINFTGSTATSVSVGTSCNSGLYLEAYDEYDNLLDVDHVDGNLYTNILSTVNVTGAGIDHVLIHDEGNFWLIDNLSVVDLLQQTLLLLPENLATILEKLETINPGATNSFIVSVNGLTNQIELILNWFSGPKNTLSPQFEVTIMRPDNTVYQQFNTSEPPCSIVIPNTQTGDWRVDIKALQIPNDDFPIALVVGQEKVSLTDIYLSNDDILLPSDVVDSVNEVMIPVVIHSSSLSDSLNFIRVRCYLDNPGTGGIQIDNDDFWLNETPGSLDTVYFHLNTHPLNGTYNVYVVIDPDKELAESDTTNNIASKSLTVLSVDNKYGQKIALFPNPNDGTFTVEIQPLSSQADLMILNSIGNVVFEENVPKSAEFRKTFTIKSMSDGIYYLKIYNENGTILKKFILH
jgi:hypothetical protein